jgi:predicted secreted hydrolase
LTIGVDGTARALRRRDIRLEPEGFWTSPDDGSRYPVAWRLALRPVGLDLSLRAAVEDQELRRPLRLWSGSVEIQGSAAGAPVSGRGFVELPGGGETSRRPGQ